MKTEAVSRITYEDWSKKLPVGGWRHWKISISGGGRNKQGGRQNALKSKIILHSTFINQASIVVRMYETQKYC